MGLVAAGVQSGLPLFLGAYLITPASGFLEELARYKQFGSDVPGRGRDRSLRRGDGRVVRRVARGSPPPRDRDRPQGGALGLAVTLELPLLIIDVQRAGPSTGMPTKPEQADLLMVLYGRNSESPVPVIAASPGRLLRRGDRGARGRDQVPDSGLPALGRVPRERLGAVANPGRGHAAGHLDQHVTEPPRSRGRSCPTPATRRRSRARGRCPARPAWSTASAAWRRTTAPATSRTTRRTTTSWCACGPARSPGSRASPSWRWTTPTGQAARPRLGRTFGPVAAGVRKAREKGGSVAHAHLRHLNPFPRNTETCSAVTSGCSIPEINLGQLSSSSGRISSSTPRLQPRARHPVPSSWRSPKRSRGCCEGGGGAGGGGGPKEACPDE